MGDDASRKGFPQRVDMAPRWSWCDAVQALAGLWLLASPVVFPGPSELAAAKDLLVGAMVLASAASAGVSERVRAAQTPLLLIMSTVLIAGSLALEFGAGQAAAARQWNQVVVGVVLAWLAAARAR